MIKHIIVLYH